MVAVTSDPGASLGELAHCTLIVPAATKWRRPGEPATSQPLGSLFDQACQDGIPRSLRGIGSPGNHPAPDALDRQRRRHEN